MYNEHARRVSVNLWPLFTQSLNNHGMVSLKPFLSRDTGLTGQTHYNLIRLICQNDGLSMVCCRKWIVKPTFLMYHSHSTWTITLNILIDNFPIWLLVMLSKTIITWLIFHNLIHIWQNKNTEMLWSSVNTGHDIGPKD